jgi:hypothetical protein
MKKISLLIAFILVISCSKEQTKILVEENLFHQLLNE